jgi:hypothetical protein
MNSTETPLNARQFIAEHSTEMARAVLAEAERAHRWIPVGEQYPRIGEFVLVVIGEVVQFTSACWSGQVWDWPDPDADCAPKEAVSHWRALPKFAAADLLAGMRGDK